MAVGEQVCCCLASVRNALTMHWNFIKQARADVVGNTENLALAIRNKQMEDYIGK